MSLRIAPRESGLVIMVVFVTAGCGSTTSGRDSNNGGNDASGSIADAAAETAPVSGGAGGDSAGADAGPPPCTPLGISVATLDAGPLWGCYERLCSTSLSACAADCTCNNGILGALSCIAGGGMQMNCFLSAATSLGGNSNAAALLGCLATGQSCLMGMVDAGNPRDARDDIVTGGDAAEVGNASDTGDASAAVDEGDASNSDGPADAHWD